MNLPIILLIVNGTLNLSLEEAKRLAVEKSPHFYAAEAKLAKSRINFTQSLSSLLPTPTSSASYTKSEIDGFETETYNGSITMSQPALDLPLFAQIKAAHYQYRGEKMSYRHELQNLMAQVEIAYLNLIRARELLKFSEHTVKRARENERLINEKFNLGAANRLDKLQAEVFSLQAETDLSQAHKAYFEVHEGLKTYLQTENMIQPTDSLAPKETVQVTSLDSLLPILENINLTLQALASTKDAAGLNLITSYFKFLPRVSLFFSYGYTANEFPKDLDMFKEHDSKSYGINIDLPLFNIKDLFFYNREARANFKYQKFLFLRTLAETKQTLITTYYALDESKKKVQLARKSLELAEEAANIAQERYRLGAASILDLLTSEENFYKAKVNYIGSITDYQIEQSRFKFLLGQLEVE